MSEKKYQLSFILAMYNADLKDVKRTIYSCINQKNIKFEIIVCDDCSEVNYKQEIANYFSNLSFFDYKFIIHDKNVGTVRNLWDGIKQAKGEYLKFISPGDYIYEETSMLDFYSFAEENNFNCVFGNAIYYSYNDGITIFPNYTSPKNKTVYKKEYIDCKKQFKQLCLYGDNISGAIVLLRKKDAEEIMNRILGVVIYCEDVALSILPLNGKRIGYLEKNIVWYQYGTGISTKGNVESTMMKKIMTDQYCFWKMIKDEFDVPKYVKRVIKYYRIRVNQRGLIDKLRKVFIAPERNIHIKNVEYKAKYDLELLMDIVSSNKNC